MRPRDAGESSDGGEAGVPPQDPDPSRQEIERQNTPEDVLWAGSTVLGEPLAVWQADDELTEARARALLVDEVGIQTEMVERMTGAEAVAWMERIRAVVRQLTASSETDELTGAMVRGPGLSALRRELARTVRTGSRLVAAFIDVDGLKSVNDQHGHLAGDRLLREVVAALRAQLRSYDLVIRYAGDEFLCVLLDTDLDDVRFRFHEVRTRLAAHTSGGSISVGMTELRPGDTIEDLIGRADQDMYDQRRRREPR